MPAAAAVHAPGSEREPCCGPLRRCIVSRQAYPKAALIRFVLGPDGALLPDLEGRLPGRGIWLQARRDVVETACAKGSFAKAARAAVKVPQGLADRLEALLRRRCLDIVGLARRAGQLAAGFEQVRGWLEAARAAVLLEASDGAAGGPPPVIATVNLSSGKVSEFSGVACPGLAGCGAANGLGYDSKTGVGCTTTEIDGGVEFYNVAQQTGFREPMPGETGQLTAGTYVVNDPVNELFLIAQPFSSTSSSGSSIQVFGEDGMLVESLNGFDLTDAGFLAIPIRIGINPERRTGWVNGPGVDQLQEFSY